MPLIPINTTNISSLPSNIPHISIIKMIAGVWGPVNPTDKPTVPKAEANSNIALCKSQFRNKVMRPVPIKKIIK